jgi:glycosyltransferase involved in cell wall biosynthesis/GT2 family glycosyltransferase
VSSIPTILHLRASNFTGGPERQILRYCGAGGQAASAPRQILATFTRAGAGGPGSEEAEGQDLLRAARAAGIAAWGLEGGGWRDLRAAAALDRLVREQGVGLICAHGYRADLIGAWIARRRHVPVAWFLRGWTGEDVRVRAYERCDRALLGWPERIVCLSQTQAASLPARVRRDRVRVVVNAIEAPAVTPAVRATAREELRQRFRFATGALPTLVAIAGRLSPEKGAADFLAAAARVRAQRPDAHYLIFGDGPLRAHLEAESGRLGLTEHVHFCGHVSDWTRLLPGLDLLINPSHSEQAPNVVLEAMAAGVAVLATAVGAVPEIGGALAGGELSLALVPAGAPASMAARMQELLADAPARTQLAARGQARVRAAYAPAHQQRQLQELYRELLEPARAAARLRAGSAAAFQAEPPAPPAPEVPRVSIVLPVRHEARRLPALLEQLLGQDYPAHRFEIVIADGGAGEAGDGTAGLAQDYARRYPGRVIWVPNPARWSSAGRNCGIAAAAGEWIVFVDGHCVLTGAGWLRASMAAAAASGAACLSRPQPLTAELDRFWPSLIARARACRIGHGADSTIYDEQVSGWVNPASSGAVYHRSLFERVGNFDESFDACEDVEFNHRLARAGVQAWLCPAAVVRYAARASLGGLWRQMVRYGRGRLRLVRKHPDAFTLAQCLPALWLAWLPLGVASVLFGHGGWRLLNASGLALYGAVVAGSSLGLGRHHGWRQGLAAPAVFFTVHAGLGAGFWRELVAPGRRRAPVPDRLPAAEFFSRSES